VDSFLLLLALVEPALIATAVRRLLKAGGDHGLPGVPSLAPLVGLREMRGERGLAVLALHAGALAILERSLVSGRAIGLVNEAELGAERRSNPTRHPLEAFDFVADLQPRTSPVRVG
jgi:hypothetical protein